MTREETVETNGSGDHDPETGAVPGLVFVFGGGKSRSVVVRLDSGVRELGRGEVEALVGDDGKISRRHAQISFDGRQWGVRDADSRNGTYVDGERVAHEVLLPWPRVIRLGESLCVPVRDVRPFERRGVSTEGGRVVGPSLGACLDRVARAAGGILHLFGESGTGKELAARHFHESGPRRTGPFVAVNCAAIPTNLAERLFFGVRRGAYSGADADADGYLHAAHDGTLFLDEVGELDAAVQAKLLRALETMTVLPLGASRTKPVAFQLVSATNTPLKRLVGDGSFRADLFYRIGRPSVSLPPLRERPEELAALAARTVVAREGFVAHASLVEAALLRVWPGNVRELLTEVRTAVDEAAANGVTLVKSRHLAPDAGARVRCDEAEADTAGGGTQPTAVSRPRVLAALHTERGNVTAAARSLGLHRTHLRRLLSRWGVEPTSFRGEPKE